MGNAEENVFGCRCFINKAMGGTEETGGQGGRTEGGKEGVNQMQQQPVLTRRKARAYLVLALTAS